VEGPALALVEHREVDVGTDDLCPGREHGQLELEQAALDRAVVDRELDGEGAA